jgi:hypothetical protein
MEEKKPKTAPDKLVVWREVDGRFDASVDTSLLGRVTTAGDLARNILSDIIGEDPGRGNIAVNRFRTALNAMIIVPGERVIFSRSDLGFWYRRINEWHGLDGDQRFEDEPRIIIPTPEGGSCPDC